MRAPSLLAGILISAVVLLAGCDATVDEEDAKETAEPTRVEDSTSEETPTPEATATSEASPTPEETENPTSEATQPPIVLEPDSVFLVAESGEQTAKVGSYFWVHDNGLALETESDGFPVHDEVLEIAPGEEVRITTEGELFPNEITLEAYAWEENLQEDIATREGRLDAFIVTEDPLQSEEFTPTDELTWTVDLEPGDYFIRLQTVWPTPEEFEDMTRRAMLAFSVRVKEES